jgi:hypothetical protein
MSSAVVNPAADISDLPQEDVKEVSAAGTLA